MKLTKKKIETIRDVIRTKRGTVDRVSALKRLGFYVHYTSTKKGGVGTLHHFKDEVRFQVGVGSWNHAYCVIFNPMDVEEVNKINEEHKK